MNGRSQKPRPQRGRQPDQNAQAGEHDHRHRMATPASWAWAASSLRGSPRNTMPKALVKQAAARPPINASAPTTTMPKIAPERDAWFGLDSRSRSARRGKSGTR